MTIALFSFSQRQSPKYPSVRGEQHNVEVGISESNDFLCLHRIQSFHKQTSVSDLVQKSIKRASKDLSSSERYRNANFVIGTFNIGGFTDLVKVGQLRL